MKSQNISVYGDVEKNPKCSILVMVGKYRHCENPRPVPQKSKKIDPLYDPAILVIKMCPKEIKITILNKYLHFPFHFHVIHNT